MSDSKAPAIRARLRYANVAEFKVGYSKFVSTGGMFIPVPESKLKPVGTDIRFQFMLSNGETVLLGRGNILQVRRPDPNTPNSPVGILVKFSKLSQDSKKIIDEIVAEKDNQKVPTQEVVLDDEVEERENYPTPAALDVVKKPDISDDKTVAGTLDDIFRSKGSSLEEATPTPEQIEERSTPPIHSKIEPDDLIFKAPEVIPTPEPESIPVEKPVSNIRLLSYEDMSTIDADKIDFGFSGDESEIDDMFDDLFGKSGDSTFFDDILGGEPVNNAPSAETPPPAPTSKVASVEPELSVLDNGTPSLEQPNPVDATEPDLPIFTTDSSIGVPPPFEAPIVEDSEAEIILEDFTKPLEPVSEEAIAPSVDTQSPDDSLSMDDAFESEPEDELFNNAPDAGAIGETASDPIELINEVYESEDENPFRADPPSIEMDLDFESNLEPVNEAVEPEREDETVALSADSFNAITANDRPDSLPQMGDFSSTEEPSVVEFDLEPDPSEVFESFDAPEEINPPAVFEADISRDGELDGLLGNLETDAPLDRSFDLNHDDETEVPEGISEDSDSLEALLALANKDIESKKEEEKDEIDILDQLLGDEQLPPLPDLESTFKMPSPESSGKKKGLFSKLFGKD